MRRLHLPIPFAAPLMVAGSLGAHALGTTLFATGAVHADEDVEQAGVEAVIRSSHGAGTILPVLAGFLIALALAVVLAQLRRTHRRGVVPPAWFLVLPPIAYAIQEMVERLIHAESFAFSPAHEPAFLAALALQIPIGLLVYQIALLLRDVARRVAAALSRAWTGAITPPPPISILVPLVVGSRMSGVARGQPVRGPPARI